MAGRQPPAQEPMTALGQHPQPVPKHEMEGQMPRMQPAMEQPPMMAQYAGDDEMGDDADMAAEAAMGLISNPNIGPALHVLQQAGQEFQTKGQAAFRNPQTLEALTLALKPIIGQSIGSPLGDGEVVGDVAIADLIPTERQTMQVKLLVQPTDEDGQPTRDPYEAMLTEGRVPEVKGGKPRELTQPEVQQMIQQLAQVYQLQQQYPEDVAKVSQGMPAREQRPMMDLLG